MRRLALGAAFLVALHASASHGQEVAPPAARGAIQSPLLPLPSYTAAPSAAPSAATSNAAFGAFQRGLYLSALRIAEPLANLGDAAAQTLLGEIYLRGLGVPQDEEEAARWFRVAADAGVPQAQFRYAVMLVDGTGVPADPEAARELMRRSADAGNPLAAFNYGQMLIRASPTGGFAEARGYFERAADAGVADGQYALSQLLINGRGGPSDAAGGFRWLKGAAERGNAIAINRVAHLYRDGVGTSRDTDEAAKWAVLARRAGNADTALDSFLRSLPQDQQRRALEAANRFGTG